MMAQDPQPIPLSAWPLDSTGPTGHGGPSGEDNIANAARIGKELLEREAALRQRLKEKHSQEEAQSKTAMIGGEQKRAQEKARKKGYRTMMSVRGRELAADKLQREKQEKLVAEEQRKLSQKRKKQQEDLQELHDTAAVKFAMEQRRNTAKREEEAQRQKIELEYRSKLLKAGQAERTSVERIERDVRSRRGIVDSETREQMFKLETLKRLKMRELENRANRELMAAKSDDLFAFERKRAALLALARTRYRRAKAELEERERAILAEDRTQKAAIDADAKIQRDEALSDRRRLSADADRWYSSRLNDIGRTNREQRKSLRRPS